MNRNFLKTGKLLGSILIFTFTLAESKNSSAVALPEIELDKTY